MENEHLETVLCDLIDAIRGITLGSIQSTVIDGAAKELICNWNDHNEEKIDVHTELNNWDNCKRDSGQYFLAKPHNCQICGCAGGH